MSSLQGCPKKNGKHPDNGSFPLVQRWLNGILKKGNHTVLL